MTLKGCWGRGDRDMQRATLLEEKWWDNHEHWFMTRPVNMRTAPGDTDWASNRTGEGTDWAGRSVSKHHLSRRAWPA